MLLAVAIDVPFVANGSGTETEQNWRRHEHQPATDCFDWLSVVRFLVLVARP